MSRYCCTPLETQNTTNAHKTLRGSLRALPPSTFSLLRRSRKETEIGSERPLDRRSPPHNLQPHHYPSATQSSGLTASCENAKTPAPAARLASPTP